MVLFGVEPSGPNLSDDRRLGGRFSGVGRFCDSSQNVLFFWRGAFGGPCARSLRDRVEGGQAWLMGTRIRRNAEMPESYMNGRAV
jgi:hypothetical protein